MSTTISEAEAQRDIARILREAGEGERFVVTADGKPIAEIVPPAHAEEAHRDTEAGELRPAARTYPPGVVPPGGGKLTPEEIEAARAALFARLESQPGVHIEPRTREELYEDEE